MSAERRANNRLVATIAAFMVAGLLVLLYSPAAQWVNAQTTAREIEARAAQTTAEPDAIERAHNYNDDLPGIAALDVAGGPLATPDSEQYDEYAGQLSSQGSSLMATLELPRLGLHLPVYHGTDDAVLNKGVGHLFGTHLPVGGAGTRAVLSAHSGLAGKELFTNLDDMQMGDTFDVHVGAETLRYRVMDIREVDPTDSEQIRPVHAKDLLTLVTCTPVGLNTKRLLVTGERVEVSGPATPRDVPEKPGLPWWAVIGVAGLLGIGAYTARSWERS